MYDIVSDSTLHMVADGGARTSQRHLIDMQYMHDSCSMRQHVLKIFEQKCPFISTYFDDDLGGG